MKLLWTVKFRLWLGVYHNVAFIAEALYKNTLELSRPYRTSATCKDRCTPGFTNITICMYHCLSQQQDTAKHSVFCCITLPAMGHVVSKACAETWFRSRVYRKTVSVRMPLLVVRVWYHVWHAVIWSYQHKHVLISMHIIAFLHCLSWFICLFEMLNSLSFCQILLLILRNWKPMWQNIQSFAHIIRLNHSKFRSFFQVKFYCTTINIQNYCTKKE